MMCLFLYFRYADALRDFEMVKYLESDNEEYELGYQSCLKQLKDPGL